MPIDNQRVAEMNAYSDRQKIEYGIFWTAVAKYSPLLVSTAVSMVLARLLLPEQFGVVALSNVFISFLTMLSSMGIAPAIIQRNDLTDDDLNSIFTFSCYIGLFLAAVLFGTAWSLAKYYETPDLATVCKLLSISLFFNTINMVPNALMTKNLRFKENAKRAFFLQLITGTISVVIAYFGGGLYALLLSPIISGIGMFLYNQHFYPVKFILIFKSNSIRKILSYSAYQFMFQFVNFFTGNIDKIVLGKVLGASDLGYYHKGYQLVQQPAGMITSVVYPVLHPIFTKYQDNLQYLYKKYIVIIQLVSSVTFPLGILLYFCGPEIIRVFYGNNWNASIPVFQILALSSAFTVILPVTGTFFQSSGQIKYLLYTGIANALFTVGYILVSCLVIGSITAVAWAIFISQLTNFIITFYFFYVKILNKHMYKAFEIFWKPLVFTLCVAVILYIENKICSNNMVLNFSLKCFSTAILMLLYLQMSHLYNIKELVNNIFCRLK